MSGDERAAIGAGFNFCAETADSASLPATIQPKAAAPRERCQAHPYLVSTLAFGLLLAVGGVDYAIRKEVSLAVFYLAPVSLATWLLGRNAGIGVACVACGISLIADLLPGDGYSDRTIAYWNALVRLVVFLCAAIALSKIRTLNHRLAETVDERTSLLTAEMRKHAQIESEIRAKNRRDQQSIAFDLHDGLCSFLTGISFKAKLLEQDLAQEGRPEAASAGAIAHLLGEAVGRTRKLSQRCDPKFLDFNELASALRQLAGETEQLFKISSSVRADLETLPLHSVAGLHLYRIAQEAVNNAVKHGEARVIDIEMQTAGTNLELIIRDNGTGFAVTNETASGMGLRSMQHRAELLGGALRIHSDMGGGTEIRCIIPNVCAHFEDEGKS